LSNGRAGAIKEAYGSFPEKAKEFYGKNGPPLKAGDTLIQNDLARSLRLIAEEGAEAFYGGEIAAAIDREMKTTGGFLSKADLAADKVEWWEPIHINYRGYDIYTASPPGTSFCSLIRLEMMSRFDPRTLGHNSAAYLHRFAEVSKHGFWCRLAYAGDPETNPPPLAKLLSEAYWKEETEKIDPNKARPFVPPGAAPQGSHHTTHFVVADRWGNLVSATQTLGNLFGSRIMPVGTGIWLNNKLKEKQIPCGVLPNTKKRDEANMKRYAGNPLALRSFKSRLINLTHLIQAGVPLVMTTDAGIWSPEVVAEMTPENKMERLDTLGKGHFFWCRAMAEKGMPGMVSSSQQHAMWQQPITSLISWGHWKKEKSQIWSSLMLIL